MGSSRHGDSVADSLSDLQRTEYASLLKDLVDADEIDSAGNSGFGGDRVASFGGEPILTLMPCSKG